jgi:hypothetical protein
MTEGHEVTEGHETRWGGLAGIEALVLVIIGSVVMGRAPKFTASATTLGTYLSAHRGQIITAALLYAIAIALFLWFGAALATAFRRANDLSDAPVVVLAGFILVSAVWFVSVSVFAGVTYAATANKAMAGAAAGPYKTLTIVSTIAGIALALPLAASAVAIVRTHLFPVWMAWFSGFVALIVILAALTAAITGHVLGPTGWVTTWIPGVLTALWVLAASLLLISERRPALFGRGPHVPGRGPHVTGDTERL